MKRIFVAAAACAAFGAQAQTKWDMPTPYSDGEFHTRNVVLFVEDVKKASNGALDIVVHANGSLIKHPDILRAVSTGQVNIAEFLLGQFGNEDPVFAVDNLPAILKIVQDYFSTKSRAAAEKYFWRNSVAAYKWVKRDHSQPPA